MDPFSWKCTTCGRPTTITDANHTSGQFSLVCSVTPEGRGIRVSGRLIECPNVDCKAQDFLVFATHGRFTQMQYGVRVLEGGPEVGIGVFKFLPTTAQPLSEFVPAFVNEDYAEAFLIRDLSPKASATLARRALQGMVRDFFELPKLKSLHHELEAIRDKCDEDLHSAMMAVKSVGNIGAHPERDVSLMVEVEPGEPQALLDLIHLLDQEWYVNRAERKARIEKMRLLGERKIVAQGRLPAPPVNALLAAAQKKP